MKPVLLDFGFISIKGYGVMVAIGFMIALYYAQTEARRLATA